VHRASNRQAELDAQVLRERRIGRRLLAAPETYTALAARPGRAMLGGLVVSAVIALVVSVIGVAGSARAGRQPDARAGARPATTRVTAPPTTTPDRNAGAGSGGAESLPATVVFGPQAEACEADVRAPDPGETGASGLGAGGTDGGGSGAGGSGAGGTDGSDLGSGTPGAGRADAGATGATPGAATGAGAVRAQAQGIAQVGVGDTSIEVVPLFTAEEVLWRVELAGFEPGCFGRDIRVTVLGGGGAELESRPFVVPESRTFSIGGWQKEGPLPRGELAGLRVEIL
jgi:hypothetical protein